MPDNKGRKNVYFCHACGARTVTIERAQGPTAPYIRCVATKGCDGLMSNSHYPAFAARMVPTHEWIRPAGVRGLSPEEIKLVQAGGLLLRKIGAEVQS